MPLYKYKCKECKNIFEKNHSMSERLTDCEHCDTIDSLTKVPFAIATTYKDSSVGKVVDEHIQDAKRDLEEEKNRMKEREYKE